MPIECIRTISNYFPQSLRYRPRKTIYAPCRTCETLHRKPTTANFMFAYSFSRSVGRSLTQSSTNFPDSCALCAHKNSRFVCISCCHCHCYHWARFLSFSHFAHHGSRLGSLCAHQLFAIKNIFSADRRTLTHHSYIKSYPPQDDFICVLH